MGPRGAGFSLAVFLMFAVALSARATADGCVYANIQPADVDFDQPRQRLGEHAELPIPPDARIGEIDIQRRQISDLSIPDQNHWYNRWGNDLHILTRESVVRARLLFSEGDPYDADVLAQSERALRDQVYLLDAWVQPYRVCGKRVDVAVVTRDMWTLRPDLGFGRAGGNNYSSIGFTDDNFLGWGKQVKIKHQTNPLRSRSYALYDDPNVAGSRWHGHLRVGNNSDGHEHKLILEHPFYRFGTSWAASFTGDYNDRVEPFYFEGDKVNEFRQRTESFEAAGARSLGVSGDTDRRIRFGYSYQDDSFATASGDLPPPDPFPVDRTLSYPWIGFELFQNRYLETMNRTRIQRVEDVQRGLHLDVRLGWSDTGYGADVNRAVLQSSVSNAVTPGEDQLLDYGVEQSGWYNAALDQVEDLTVDFKSRYWYGGVHENRSWYAALDLGWAKNLTADQRFVLGGETGLRGYPFRYQSGDRRALFTLERRYFTDWHPWDLFRVGGAAFFDMGRTWFHDRDNGPNGGWLRDVGVGLRIASDRVESDKILHVDVAFPLDGGSDIDKVQLLVYGQTEF